MTFSPGDLSHNISKIMQDFMRDQQVTLKTVKDLTELHTRVEILQLLEENTDEIFRQFTDAWETLQIYCEHNRDTIVQVFPCLKQPLSEYLNDNPYDDNDMSQFDEAIDYETSQSEIWKQHLGKALEDL